MLCYVCYRFGSRTEGQNGASNVAKRCHASAAATAEIPQHINNIVIILVVAATVIVRMIPCYMTSSVS